MPQISQLPLVFWSQLFWLAVIFGAIFFGIGRGTLPKIQATVHARDNKIAEDLEHAQAARVAADETEAEWRARMDSARADATRLAQKAKQESAAQTEATVKKAAERINLKIDTAEAKIRDAVNAARAEIEAVAAEAAQDMVVRLTGINVGTKDAAQ